MSQRSDVASFSLGGWIVHPDRDLLVRAAFGRGEEKRVTPLEMKLLLRLARDPGRVVSKGVLLDDVWEGAVVVDHVLAKTMSKLRASLGDDARSPRFIETVGRRGYRLLERPKPVDRPARRPVRSDASLVHRRRLLTAAAVLASFVGGLSVPTGDAPGEIVIETSVRVAESVAVGHRADSESVRVPVRIEIPPADDDERSEGTERLHWKFEIVSSPEHRG